MPNAIRVFSNPTAGAFSVMIHSVQKERIGYAVYDDQGRRITAGMALPNTLFNVGSEFRTGLYILVADMKGEKITVKLIKQ